MSVPPRVIAPEFPAASIGPSITETTTAVPPSIIHGINYSRNFRNDNRPVPFKPRTHKHPKVLRNAPGLLMAGQKQIDGNSRSSKGSPYVQQDKKPTRSKKEVEISQDEPHLLVTQGKSLQFPRRQYTMDQITMAKNKRFASVSAANDPKKKRETQPTSFQEFKKEIEGHFEKAKKGQGFTLEKVKEMGVFEGKNLSFGKQRESLIMAYWEDQEDKRLKTESLIPQTLSLAERLRQRQNSKEDLRIEGYSGRVDETESLEIASYLKVMPVQLEETAIRKKYEPSRQEAMKQVQMRRLSQRRMTGSLSIDSKVVKDLKGQFANALNISALQAQPGIRSTTSALQKTPGGSLHGVSLKEDAFQIQRQNDSLSDYEAHKFEMDQRQQDFKNVMSSLADQIDNYGIRLPEGGDKASKGSEFASIMSSALNLTQEQQEHLQGLRDPITVVETENSDNKSAHFQPLKITAPSPAMYGLAMQKQLQHLNQALSGRDKKDARMLVPFAKKMLLAGINFHSQLCQINPKYKDLSGHQQLQQIINISSIDRSSLSPLRQAIDSPQPTTSHQKRGVQNNSHRTHLKRRGGGGTELVHGGALQVGTAHSSQKPIKLGIGGYKIGIPHIPPVMVSALDPIARQRGPSLPLKMHGSHRDVDRRGIRVADDEERLKTSNHISRQHSPIDNGRPLDTVKLSKRGQRMIPHGARNMFDNPVTAIATQDMIDNNLTPPPSKPFAGILSSFLGTPSHIRSYSKQFKDSLIKLHQTVVREHETERKERQDGIPQYLLPENELAMQEQFYERQAIAQRLNQQKPRHNQPKLSTRITSRQTSPMRKITTKGPSPVKVPKARYKFPETGLGRAIDIINYQCMRYELNPLEFQKDLLVNLNQIAVPEPSAASIEQTERGGQDLDNNFPQDSCPPREKPPAQDYQPRNKEYTHLRNQKLNVIFRLANVFNAHVFKRKSGNPDINFVLKLSKVLGLKLTRNQLAKDPQIFKNNKDFAVSVRDRLIASVHQAINESNGVIVERTPGHVKFYVNRGNNGMLVRSIMKKRWWWTMNDKENVDDCHVIWTQWRKNKIINKLKMAGQTELRMLNDASAVNQSSTTATTLSDRKFSKRGLVRNNSSSEGEELLPRMAQTLSKLKGTEDEEEKQEGANLDESKDLEPQKNASPSQNKKQIVIIPEEAPPPLESKIPHPKVFQSNSIKIYNRLEDNFHISNKKAMFINLRNYYEAVGRDVFSGVPVTFHIQNGLDDPEFQKFCQFYQDVELRCKEVDTLLSAQKQARLKQQQTADSGSDSGGEEESPVKRSQLKSRKNIWIVKPGENSNRGQGIHVCRQIQEIETLITNYYQNKKNRTVIVQQYIDRPLLIHKRKFDIRCYSLVTSINGLMKGFAYNEGYVRTSSREFKLKNLKDKIIHLTNDAVQKKSDDYGKFEAANKISYAEFQKYIETTYPERGIRFYRHINTQIKRLITDTIRSVYGKMDPNKRLNCFEIFGYDFMVDQEFNVYLIEVNTNPDISLCCPLLAMLIPTMLDNAFRIAIDPLLPPPDVASATVNRSKHSQIMPENKFQLIFDERYDGQQIRELLKDRKVEIMDEESCEEDSSDEDAPPEQDE